MLPWEPDNQKYRTVFSARNEANSRSLQNVGLASLDMKSPDSFNHGMMANDQDMRMPAGAPSGMDPKHIQKLTYAQELQLQMKEKHLQKVRSLENDRVSDHMMLEHRAYNDPFGRQGAGAPIRDQFGRIITTRKKEPFQAYGVNASVDSPGMMRSPYLQDQYSPGIPTNAQSQQFQPQQFQPQQFQPQQLMMQQQASSPLPNMQAYSNSPLPQLPQQYQVQPPYQTQAQPSQYQQQVQLSHQDSASTIPLSSNRYVSVPGLNINSINTGGTTFSPAIISGADNNEKVDKMRRLHNHLELQQENLQMVEQKRRRDEEEKHRKKMEDLMDEERVRRENEEFERQNGLKTGKLQHRNLNVSVVTERGKKNGSPGMAPGPDPGLSTIQSNTMQSNMTLNISPMGYKNPNKRPRTPIEEVEEMRHEQFNHSSTTKVEIEQKIIKELPIEVEKQVQKVVEEELRQLRNNFAHEQQGFSHQLMDLKHQSVTANKERDAAHREIEEMKYRIKQQQVRDSIRQDELYKALVRNNDRPAIIKTNTRIDADSEQMRFAFPESDPRKDYYKKARGGGEGEINVFQEFEQQSKLISMSHGLLNTVSRPESREYDFSSANDAINQLKYFDTNNDYDNVGNQGIQFSDTVGKYNLPDDGDDWHRLTSLPIAEDGGGDGIIGILRKNNERLNMLEGLEHDQINRFDKARRGREDAKLRYDPDDNGFSDEMIQEVNHKYGDDYGDILLQKINNPRAYL